MYVPLRQASQEVAARALLGERCDLEPAGAAVLAGPLVARNGVLDNIAPGASGLDLGRRGQVANQGNLSDVAGGRGGEGASSGGSPRHEAWCDGGGCAASEE